MEYPSLLPDDAGTSGMLQVIPEKTPWFRRFGEPFPGKLIPFGAGVYFKPAPAKYKWSKGAPRLQFGVFMG